jgi:hypothetical protein
MNCKLGDLARIQLHDFGVNLRLVSQVKEHLW